MRNFAGGEVSRFFPTTKSSTRKLKKKDLWQCVNLGTAGNYMGDLHTPGSLTNFSQKNGSLTNFSKKKRKFN